MRNVVQVLVRSFRTKVRTVLRYDDYFKILVYDYTFRYIYFSMREKVIKYYCPTDDLLQDKVDWIFSLTDFIMQYFVKILITAYSL